MQRSPHVLPSSPRALRCVLYLALVSAGLYALFGRWSYDDPYITYRYAANLADGIGLVYNPGARVLSTTSPLLAIILAGLNRAGADIPAAAHALGALSVAGGGWLLLEIGRQLDTPAAGLAGAVLYPTSTLLVGTLGSEMPIYLALCLGAAWCYLKRGYALTGALLGLAALMRADALVLAGVLAADWLVRTARSERSLLQAVRALPVSGVLTATVFLVSWGIFSQVYYGALLPITLFVKQAQGVLTPDSRFLPVLQGLAERLLIEPHNWVLFAFMAVGFSFAVRGRSRWLPILLWPILFAAGYITLGVAGYFWYYAPLAPGAVAAASLGIGELHGLRKPTWAESRTWDGYQTAAALALVFLAAGQVIDVVRLRANPDTRYPIYREVGSWLAENTDPADTIGALEVGIIGFVARPRAMVDFAGLLQPDIALNVRTSGSFQETALAAALEYRPDYLVLHPGYELLRQVYIPGRCAPAAVFFGADFGHPLNLTVYECD